MVVVVSGGRRVCEGVGLLLKELLVVVVREERDRTALVRGMRRRRVALGGTRRVGRGGILSRDSPGDYEGGRGSNGRDSWFAPR